MQTSELITSGKLTTITNLGGRRVVYNNYLGAFTMPTVPEAIGFLGHMVGLMAVNAVTDAANEISEKVTNLVGNKNEETEDEN